MRSCLLLLSSLALSACLSGGGPAEGLAPTPPGVGPAVVFDWDARPLPEVPFPTDLATWADPDSPTGLRINVSLRADTELERKIRRKAQAVTGFGTYGPITVGFDGPLDAGRIRELHADDDWTNDAVWVVNVDRDSPAFGDFVPLSLGGGHVPIVLEQRDRYFQGDNRAHTTNLLFDTTDEDLDGDGRLDPAEDTDGDGVLDRPNVWPDGGDPVDDLLTFYERETSTLVIRVQRPMAQRATHAVVLTRRLVDGKGRAVRSPFPWVNHVRQTEALEPLPGLLEERGASLDDVAFAWTVTTQDVTGDLEALRAGLYGHGPLSHLATRYPPEVSMLHQMVDEGHPEAEAGNRYALAVQALAPLLGAAAVQVLGLEAEAVDVMTRSMRYIDFFVAGAFESPYLLFDRDGVAIPGRPGDEDESWDVDPGTGRLVEERGRVAFFCAVPRPLGERQPPFPVVVIGHGYGSNRLEMLSFAGSLAKFGFAGCSIDAAGHGMPGLDEDETALVEGFTAVAGVSGMVDAIRDGRARDLDNDGDVDSGGDYWTADVFHTRDMVRQSALDTMALVRLLRSFDESRRWTLDLDGNGERELAGDFTSDGQVDVGGPDNDYYMVGGSLGGILTGVLAGIEPALVAAAPVVGGAGLTDVAIRSTQTGVPEAAILLMMGPLVVLREPDGDGNRQLEFVVPRVADDATLPFAVLGPDEVAGGDWLEVEVDHLSTGVSEVRRVPIPADGRATRVHIAADADGVSIRAARLGLPLVPAEDPAEWPEVPEDMLLGDPMVVRIRRGGGEAGTGEVRYEVTTFEQEVRFMSHRWPEGAPLVAPAGGFGHRRATPDLRRFFSIAAALLEPGDPVGYAPHHSLDPLTYDYDPDVEPGCHVLHVPTIGDMNVPVNTGIAMARAGGALTAAEHRRLIDAWVVEAVEGLDRYTDNQGTGVLIDADDLSDDTDQFADREVPRLDPPLRATHEDDLGGASGMRLPYVRPSGAHGIGPPKPTLPFDVNTYTINVIGRFFELRGAPGSILDERCLADDSCDYILPPPE